ncbi:Cytidine and deoxycytidylate deaminase zinc-binding region [compost metagenome]
MLTDPKRRVAGVGYNGPPEDFDDHELTEENSTFVVIHAELNALQNSVGTGLTMTITHQSCLPCAAAIVASQRVVEVVFPPVGSTGRWSESQKQAIKHFEKKGIKVTYSG